MQKEKLIKSVELRLSTFLDAGTLDRVKDVLIIELGSYSVTETGTEIIPYDDENARILKTYLACISLEGKSPKTVKQYKHALEKLADIVGKNYLEMKNYDLLRFFSIQKTKGCSNRTLENTRAYFSAFFQWLTAEEYIPANPAAKIKPFKYHEEIKPPFSTTDIDQMRSACKKPKERAMIEFLLSSGVRVSELCDLNISDVDFLKKTVSVLHGKGDKARTTYIDDLTVMHLRHYLAVRKDDSEALFINNNGDRIGTGGVEYLIKVIAKRAGIEKAHPHRFRRTLATTLASRGMPVQDVQKILGHSDIDTTMIYVNVSDAQTHGSYMRYTA